MDRKSLLARKEGSRYCFRVNARDIPPKGGKFLRPDRQADSSGRNRIDSSSFYVIKHSVIRYREPF